MSGKKVPKRSVVKPGLPKEELFLLPKALEDKLTINDPEAGKRPIRDDERGKIAFDRDHNLYHFKTKKAAQEAVEESKPSWKKAVYGIGMGVDALKSIPRRAGSTLITAVQESAFYIRENALALAGIGLGSYGSIECIYNKPLGLGMVVVGAGMIIGQEIIKKSRQK